MTQHGAPKQRAPFGAMAMAMALLAVAGCTSTAPRQAAQTVAPPPPTPVVLAPPVDPGLPQHRVALLVPTTGGNAAVGQSIANAANMALLDSNDRNLKLTVYNTAATASGSTVHAGGSIQTSGPLVVRSKVPSRSTVTKSRPQSNW